MKTCIHLALLALIAAPAFAATEREQLAQSRTAIEARFAEQSKECSHRFAVNSCMDAARAERSTALKPIVHREQQLEAQERRARAEEQVRRVHERQQEAAKAEAERLVAPIKASEPKALKPEPKPRPVTDPVKRAEAQQSREEAAERGAEKNRAAQLKRQQQLELRRKDAQKNAEKVKAKGAESLPVPSPAEIAKLKADSAASAASAVRR
jgi:hypothetical protein